MKKKMKALPPALPHYPQMNLSRYLMIFFFFWPALFYFLLFLCSLLLSPFLSLSLCVFRCGNQEQSHTSFIGTKYFKNHLQFRGNNASNSIMLWRKRSFCGWQMNSGHPAVIRAPDINQSRYLLLM